MKNKISAEIKLDKLEAKLRDNHLLSNGQLGGEIPFFIFPYSNEEHNMVEKGIANIIHKASITGMKILLIDLFELAIEILNSKKIFNPVMSKESTMEKSKFLQRLRIPLDVNNVIIPAIAAKLADQQPDLLLVKGVGAVYPIVRSHLLLNNLQSIMKDIPMIMFYPGEFNNFTLQLFGKLKDDNYYRAFNLEDILI